MQLWLKALLVTAVLLILAGCRLRPEAPAESITENFDAAQGVLSFPVRLNDVWLQVDQVQSISAEPSGRAGYAYIILTLSVFNESNNPVIPSTFLLVDEFDNQYISRQDGVTPPGLTVQQMPLSVDNGQSASGNELFLVPTSALQGNLRLRWESEVHNSRIEVLIPEGNLQ